VILSAPAVSLLVGALARGSAAAPLWAVIVAIIVVLVALYVLLGNRRLPFVRSAASTDAQRNDDPVDPAA
jgi:hypothetical protein